MCGMQWRVSESHICTACVTRLVGGRDFVMCNSIAAGWNYDCRLPHSPSPASSDCDKAMFCMRSCRTHTCMHVQLSYLHVCCSCVKQHMLLKEVSFMLQVLSCSTALRCLETLTRLCCTQRALLPSVWTRLVLLIDRL
jgi:hypothetical protein